MCVCVCVCVCMCVRSCRAIAWLDANQWGEKEEYEHKLTELQNYANPILAAAGGGGVPGGGVPGGGPSIEEVD